MTNPYPDYVLGSHQHVSSEPEPRAGDNAGQMAAWSRWWERQHPDDKRGECHVEAEIREATGLCRHNRTPADCEVCR